MIMFSSGRKLLELVYQHSQQLELQQQLRHPKTSQTAFMQPLAEIQGVTPFEGRLVKEEDHNYDTVFV